MYLVRFLTDLKLKTTAGWCTIGFVVMMLGGLTTESVFAKVAYPGAGFGGVPLTFDLQLKRENLGRLEQQGTLDLFVIVQYLDIGIIIGTLLFFTFLALLITKAFSAYRGWHNLGVLTVVAFLIAPVMDALENISILILITFRQFDDLKWLSFLNSCFTLGKIVFFIFGWVLTSIMLVALAVRLVNRLFLGKTK